MRHTMKFLFILSLVLIHFNHLKAVPLPIPSNGEPIITEQHQGCAPYITGSNFRVCADHIIESSLEWFDPDCVKQGDAIYINMGLMDWFDKYVHDQIEHPYILISNDGGDRIPCPYQFPKLLYDPKCAAWFCRGMLFSYHPKLHQIPFGQTIWNWKDSDNSILKLDNKIKMKPFTKHHLLYMNHYPRLHGGRDKIVKLFENVPYCLSRNRSTQTQYEYVVLPVEDYFHDLSISHYVISPLGLETDCIRTWEAILLNCIPIVEHSFNDPLYEELPVLLVYEWEQVNEQFLLDKLKTFEGYRVEKAYFDFWHRKIKETQNQIRNGDYDDSTLEATLWDQQDVDDLNWILEKETLRNVLIYKGFLSSMHPLQLAKSLPYLSVICLYDPWLNTKTFGDFKNYMQDESLSINSHKIYFLTSEKEFNRFIEDGHHCPVFLDLSYFRHGLCRNFNFVDCHHSLERDVRDLYEQLNEGTLLCGNMANNDYVHEVLMRLTEKNGLSFGYRGNFWFLKK